MPEKAKKILIVEDEKPMAHALELKLGHSGFATQVAYDGEAALEITKQNKFDIILLDLMVPKVDGFGVIKELKKRKDTTPVIVASNLGQNEDMQRAKELGAKWYFVKSDTPISKIVEEVEKILGNSPNSPNF